MTQEQLLIKEVARASGVSVRTIRYYIAEGLLSTPPVRGRYTVYDEDYIYRIRLIKRLQDAYLPLKEIRLLTEDLDAEEVKILLAQYEGTDGDRLLAERPLMISDETSPTLSLEDDNHQETPRPALGMMGAESRRKDAKSESESALDYISRLLEQKSSLSSTFRDFKSTSNPAAAPGQPQTPASQPRRAPGSATPAPARPALLAEAQPSLPLPGIQSGEPWRRIPLVPGLELHAAESGLERNAGLIRQIIDFIQQNSRPQGA